MPAVFNPDVAAAALEKASTTAQAVKVAITLERKKTELHASGKCNCFNAIKKAVAAERWKTRDAVKNAVEAERKKRAYFVQQARIKERRLFEEGKGSFIDKHGVRRKRKRELYFLDPEDQNKIQWELDESQEERQGRIAEFRPWE